MSWSNLTQWWLTEIVDDPAYAEVVTPLLFEILQPSSRETYLDLGCGEGRVMRAVSDQGATVHGLDINPDLARLAGQAVAGDILDIPMRADAYDAVYSVLTLEHVSDHERFFAETVRVTKPNGVLAFVLNHPVWTAPGSTPITDDDGELLWRSGDYFGRGSSEGPAGDDTVIFHHRSMAHLLNAAADSGWSLEHMIERPHHQYEDQADIPRLLACRWRLIA